MTDLRTAAGLLLLLAGCAAFDPDAERTRVADRIVAEAVSASRASAAEQKAALSRAQAAFAAEPMVQNRVRLAALLATLPPPHRDDARALELLEPAANLNSPGPGRLAALLASMIGERQRATRERVASDGEREKREEAMRQQLEALRAIERGMIEREEKLRRRQR
jgi:hypothetical protein